MEPAIYSCNGKLLQNKNGTDSLPLHVRGRVRTYYARRKTMNIKESLKGKHFLKIKDFTPEEIEYLIDLAAELKAKKKAGEPVDMFRGKNIALIFEKTSTRTRCAFEVAGHDLGMGVTYLDPSGSQIGKKESIADTAKVLGRMFDGIEYRFTYMGDARYNMGNSLMVGCAKMGMHFTACTSKKYFPDPELVKYCEELAAKTGGSVRLTEDPEEGTKGADVIYTDVWVSMGEPDEVWAERIEELSPYQVNRRAMENAGPQCVFMHCLPAFHDLNTGIGAEIEKKFGIKEMEVTDEVFLSPQSIVFDEAENRMHTIKAVMAATL